MTIALLGLGNVGFWTAVQLALVAVREAEEFRVFLVDYDDVDDRAIRKGYSPRLEGMRKTDAAIEAIRGFFGESIASRFAPVFSAIQGTPGLIAEADASLLCLDSFGASAFASRLASAGWQCRISTGVGNLAQHSIEVFPPDTSTVEEALDNAAWSEAAVRKSCLTGLPGNPVDGADFPIGTVGPAIAVNAFLHRAGDATPWQVLVSGTDIGRYEYRGTRRQAVRFERLDVDHGTTLSALWNRLTTGIFPSRATIEFELPIVERHCGCGGYLGFERYPITSTCLQCRMPRIRVDSWLDLTPELLGRIGPDRTLAELFAPAGIGAWVHGGPAPRPVRLSWRPEDVPPPLTALKE
jgi:hypothetical protein